ncbi:hypothetical protein FHS90_004652 [Rufibacter quisquiliarum]|uniref:Lipoprotein n=1 Tax=Rufibacter quisquiliarum TaxID=1549639 RepID=A0A839GYZ0_9BACT|nr:hypothetical protein [Rufibacter quisquiliarum]
MKRSLTIFLLILLSSCSKREDIVFSAFDELHYLQLYDKNSDFEILYNGVNTAKGKYLVKNDTIYLNYDSGQFLNRDNQKSEEADKLLTRQVKIDRRTGRIQAVDDKNFCANINIDRLKNL